MTINFDKFDNVLSSEDNSKMASSSLYQLLGSCLILYTVAVQASDRNSARIRAHETSPFFYDGHGRVRLFHGINAVKKAFPWYEPAFLSNTRLDHLQGWGLNVVRLGIMWSGVEPNEGEYNSTYINIMKDMVRRLGQRGIYTLLDMHQDCATSKYESYDGFPRWLVDKFPESPNPYPWPQDRITFWEQKYFTQAVSQVFQHVYNNTADSLNKWAEFWKYVAENFKDEEYVIGYNIINEPWVGDYFQFEDIFWPGIAGRVNLAPSYEVIHNYIREVDNHTIFFYEPVMYGMVMHDEVLGSGFDKVPGGDLYRNVSAYSYHAYCWFLEFVERNATEKQKLEAKQFCDTEFFPGIMDATLENLEQTGGASMLTEYGLCHTYEQGVNVRCEDMLNLCDQYLQSWTDWDYADYKWYRNEQPVMPKIKPYIRPYARAIAGTPTNMTFDPKTDYFELKFDLDRSITAPTEIYVPSLRYSAFNVEVSDNLRNVVTTNKQTVLLRPKAGTQSVPAVVKISKSPVRGTGTIHQYSTVTMLTLLALSKMYA